MYFACVFRLDRVLTQETQSSVFSVTYFSTQAQMVLKYLICLRLFLYLPALVRFTSQYLSPTSLPLQPPLTLPCPTGEMHLTTSASDSSSLLFPSKKKHTNKFLECCYCRCFLIIISILFIPLFTEVDNVL